MTTGVLRKEELIVRWQIGDRSATYREVVKVPAFQLPYVIKGHLGLGLKDAFSHFNPITFAEGCLNLVQEFLRLGSAFRFTIVFRQHHFR